MASSPAGVAGVFDRAADTYDDIGVPWFQPIAQASSTSRRCSR